MSKELVYTFSYKLSSGVEGAVEIKAKSYYEACSKFDDWKIEFGLDSDSDHEIVDLCYRVSGLTDIYSKEQRDIKKNKYVLINMETMKVHIVRNETNLEDKLAPFDKADTIVSNSNKELIDNFNEIVFDYEENN